ncbi:TRAP-type C4-dicarboxylate transport system permease small subunit [Mesorhizobium sp. J18]|uniref:TRAP transporter small permease n=1 Tax=Mesorhizobium sp. J18 TaxID=935263 RepID=UPI0011993157|nr:TRAP transporter small permease subunit [Mesorhizobium sp. J18]TWG97938.1 TRAP-type C4-dicarboxylate transport system permease small subunit [Mesorhizobium sp. J18]
MRALYSYLLRIEAILAGIFLLLMVGLIFTGGVARLMRNPLNWTIDLATCFFAWACFLCADIAWRNNSLMSINLVAERAPERMRQALAYLNYLIISIFLVYLIYSGLLLSWVSRARSFNGIPGVSYSWVTMSLPVGATLLLITTILKVRQAMLDDGLLRRPAVSTE